MATFLDLSVFEGFKVIFSFLLIYVLVYGVLLFGKPLGKAGGSDKNAKGLYGIIALAIAILSVTNSNVTRFIEFSIPWFFVVALIAFFIIFMLKLFGGEGLDLKKAITGGETRVWTWIIILTIVIILFGLGNSFGAETLQAGQWDGTGTPPDGYTADNGDQYVDGEWVDENGAPLDGFIDDTGLGNTGTTGSRVATNNYDTNVINTLVNPKVLGMILILLMGMIAIFFIAT